MHFPYIVWSRQFDNAISKPLWMIALNLCSPSCPQLFLIVCFSSTIQSWKQPMRGLKLIMWPEGQWEASNLCSPSCLHLFLIVRFSTTIQSWKQFPLLKANQESEVFLRMAVREIQVALYTWNGLFSHRVRPLAPSDTVFLEAFHWPWDHMISSQASHWSSLPPSLSYFSIGIPPHPPNKKIIKFFLQKI